MFRHKLVLPATLLLAIVVFTLQTTACGTSSSANRVLSSITVTPATADAQNFTNGQVQFTATGAFSKPPSPAPMPFVSPYSGSWEISDLNIATISQSGVAQCVAGASGTVKVIAIASANSAMGPAMSVAVSGSAQLTCP
jgi:hypothetical protein